VAEMRKLCLLGGPNLQLATCSLQPALAVSIAPEMVRAFMFVPNVQLATCNLQPNLHPTEFS
jgi:hypothetical protein